jgi:SPP1 family predicted phage head-tail adaptor
MREPSIGRLNKRIILQSRSGTKDTVGGQSETWTNVATVWAMLEPSFGRELLTAQAMSIDHPMTICIRYQAAFANPKTVAAMRAVYGSRIFDIHDSVNLNEGNRFLVMIASEGMNNG